jgi:hypothetical protein
MKRPHETRVEWDALRQLLRKAGEGLHYQKGASGEASLQSIVLAIITSMRVIDRGKRHILFSS